ncbi:MAG: hypothetical protein ACJAWH_001910 [Maribacter sp.]|jgi:hypothetical protein
MGRSIKKYLFIKPRGVHATHKIQNMGTDDFILGRKHMPLAYRDYVILN